VTSDSAPCFWGGSKAVCCARQCRLMAHRDMLHCGGQASLTEHCGHGWTCSLPGPIAIDTREPPVGALEKGLLRPRLSAIIMSSRLPASHPDCRAVLIQIVAL
jgi:hypothetical protein